MISPKKPIPFQRIHELILEMFSIHTGIPKISWFPVQEFRQGGFPPETFLLQIFPQRLESERNTEDFYAVTEIAGKLQTRTNNTVVNIVK